MRSPPPELGAPAVLGASAVQKRLDAFRRHWPLHGQRLLDVGCGNGAYTLELARSFAEVVAVDVEPQHLASFRHQLRESPLSARVDVREMSATRMHLPDDHFDVVTAIEVIEHFDDLDASLREIARVLKPGGALCLTCPNRLFPVETHMVRIPWSSKSVPGKRVPFLPWAPALHRKLASARTFLPRDLRALLGGVGLTEEAVDYVMPPFDHWAFGRRFLRPITERLERTPLKVFGVSIVAVFSKS
jgi:ubiquinone/menaquinone biosynthesis C-methylase UbiE